MSLENPVGTEVRQKPGPLQTIFELPPDEVCLGILSRLFSSVEMLMHRDVILEGSIPQADWSQNTEC